MAKFKLTLKNSFAIMFAIIGSFVSSGVYAQDAEKTDEDQSSPKAAGKEAAKKAKGKEEAQNKSSASNGKVNVALRKQKRPLTGEMVRTAVLPADTRGRWISRTAV